MLGGDIIHHNAIKTMQTEIRLKNLLNFQIASFLKTTSLELTLPDCVLVKSTFLPELWTKTIKMYNFTKFHSI